MPIHDWSRAADAGAFRDFHTTWGVEIKRRLNRLLPAGFYALVEQHALGLVPDILTTEGQRPPDAEPRAGDGGSATATLVRPAARARRPRQRPPARHVAVRRSDGRRLVAVIGIVSPGNKDHIDSLRAFVGKSVELLTAGVHLMVLDVWPPDADVSGIHGAIWGQLADGYSPPADKPLTFSAYEVGRDIAAYVAPAAVGDPLPTLPLFLEPGRHIDLALEPMYAAALEDVPPDARAGLS